MNLVPVVTFVQCNLILVCVSFQVKWQAGLFDIIHSSKFETFIMILICFNMLVMMIQHYGQSREVELTMNILLCISSENNLFSKLQGGPAQGLHACAMGSNRSLTNCISHFGAPGLWTSTLPCFKNSQLSCFSSSNWIFSVCLLQVCISKLGNTNLYP